MPIGGVPTRGGAGGGELVGNPNDRGGGGSGAIGNHVWSLSQFFSVSFLHSRIIAKVFFTQFRVVSVDSMLSWGTCLVYSTPDGVLVSLTLKKQGTLEVR